MRNRLSVHVHITDGAFELHGYLFTSVGPHWLITWIFGAQASGDSSYTRSFSCQIYLPFLCLSYLPKLTTNIERGKKSYASGNKLVPYDGLKIQIGFETSLRAPWIVSEIDRQTAVALGLRIYRDARGVPGLQQ